MANWATRADTININSATAGVLAQTADAVPAEMDVFITAAPRAFDASSWRDETVAAR
jgi:hypothetical protein